VFDLKPETAPGASAPLLRLRLQPEVSAPCGSGPTTLVAGKKLSLNGSESIYNSHEDPEPVMADPFFLEPIPDPNSYDGGYESAF
jgi:hypothetical protein